jgi:hypothetical protein
MSDSDDTIGGCVGAVVIVVLAAAALVAAILILSTVGSVFGAGTALQNYVAAFRGNVKPEQVTP